jgi:hypothetical protein
MALLKKRLPVSIFICLVVFVSGCAYSGGAARMAGMGELVYGGNYTYVNGQGANSQNSYTFSMTGGYMLGEYFELGGALVGSAGYTTAPWGASTSKSKTYLDFMGPAVTLNFGNLDGVMPFVRVLGGMCQGRTYWKLGALSGSASDTGSFYGGETGLRIQVGKNAFTNLSWLLIQSTFDDSMGGNKDISVLTVGLGLIF